MRVLHVMPYDGPGGFCRVILDLCKQTRSSHPSVAVFREGMWTPRFREAGIRVDNVTEIMARRRIADRLRGLEALVEGIDLINVHLGPVLQDQVAAFPEMLGIPATFTLHYAYRIPVSNAHIICTSPWLVALQRPSNTCHVITNGVDVVRFRPPAGPPRDPIIVRVCRPERCAHYFWDAVEPVLRRHPRAKLWILGESGSSSSQVVYWGYRDDVPAMLRRASILAYTPRPNEGAFDLAILEAMASGVVPIVTDVDCVAEAVTSGRDGVLVPYGDVLAFERALDRAVGDPARVAKMAASARKTATARYDIRDVAREYDRVYKAILTPRSRGTRSARRARDR